jgi:HEXXH motif-containing protein
MALREDDFEQVMSAILGIALKFVAPRRKIDWEGPYFGSKPRIWQSAVLPLGQRISIQSNGRKVTVSIDGQPMAAAAVPGAIARGETPERSFQVFSPGEARELFPDLSDLVSSASDAQILSCIDEALKLLRWVPDYEEWVLRVLRAVAPMCVRDDTNFSRSYIYRPGLIAASCPVSPTIFAELLVHEATHQYFYLLSTMDPVDDGSDHELYYSPVKDCGRPIYNILLSYHAFGNILMFHRSLLDRRAPVEREFSSARVSQIQKYLPVFGAALRSSSAITETGHAIWVPLSKLIADASHSLEA